MSSKELSAETPVRIDRSLCKACGICIAFCPKQVLEADEGGIAVVAHPEECIRCRMCELRCPDFAVTVRGDRGG